tara:strand:- start:118 stop:492 length:375 start_codon:yes stop_codon:yes gene_type:complete
VSDGGNIPSYEERVSGLIAMGFPRSLAAVVAFRPELVAELGNAASIAMNPGQFVLEEVADRKGVSKPKQRRKKQTAHGKMLSRALVEQNAKQRKKNGEYKKGKSAATVMKAAQAQVRREKKRMK